MNTQSVKILLVDDEEKFLKSLSARIHLKGFTPLMASRGEDAIHIAKSNRIDIAIVDYKMPGMDGIITITKLKEIHPHIKTILLTAFGNEKLRQAGEGLESAFFRKDEMPDFWNFIRQFSRETGMIIIRPDFAGKGQSITESVGFPVKFQHCMEDKALSMYAGQYATERQFPKIESGHPRVAFSPHSQKLIGESPSIVELKKNIQKVAPLDCNVLILGETGTGKELVARAIHMFSHRSDKKFFPVNCGSFSEELLTNELFGHEKEAFTGSVNYKIGFFEAASGGTVFLDEIGDMPVSMQTKLLRVLQEKTIIRLGGNDEIPIDVRILTATHQSLKKQTEDGYFRKDIYYRLNTFIIQIPPLRERRDDIPLLCSYFLARFRNEFDKNISYISPEALSALMKHPFPGNVRELENTIERAVIMCEGNIIKKEHLPKRLYNASSSDIDVPSKAFVTLAELEKQYIQKVLAHTRGNKSKAARLLGINRASLWRKLKEIEKEKFETV